MITINGNDQGTSLAKWGGLFMRSGSLQCRGRNLPVFLNENIYWNMRTCLIYYAVWNIGFGSYLYGSGLRGNGSRCKFRSCLGTSL